MQVLVRISDLYSFQQMKERINLSGAPSLLLDSGLKIAAKNRAVMSLCPNIRKGAKISKYISRSDTARFYELIYGDLFSCEMTVDGRTFGANILRGEDFWVLTFHPVSAEIFAGLKTVYEKMSGKDISVSGSYLNIEEILNNKFSYKKTALFWDAVSGYFDIKGLSFFNVSEVLDIFSRTLQQSSRKFAGKIRVKSKHSEKLIRGSSRDFALLISVLIFFLDGKGRTVDLEYFETVAEAVCLVSLSKEKEDKCPVFASFNNDFHSENIDDSALWFHLIKLLADGNLWEISWEEIGDTHIEFMFRAPYTTPFGEYTLHDSLPEFLSELFMTFFE